MVNAPMGGAAGGRLAAAVSRAGGLGMIGMGSAATTAQLRTAIGDYDAPDRPFGIGLVHWVMTADPELFEAALAAQPTVLCVSFGADWSWVATAKSHGIITATQIADPDAAVRAVDAGVDLVVARGLEGGGHGAPRIGTLPLLAEVLDRVQVPVLAAGGISSPRAVAAVLAAGAAGAWVGTAFAACAEALTSDPARTALLAADADATVTTDEFDIAANYPWPATLPERVLIDDTGAPTPVNAGQGVGAVHEFLTAAELMDRLCSGAEELLRRCSSS